MNEMKIHNNNKRLELNVVGQEWYKSLVRQAVNSFNEDNPTINKQICINEAASSELANIEVVFCKFLQKRLLEEVTTQLAKEIG